MSVEKDIEIKIEKYPNGVIKSREHWKSDGSILYESWDSFGQPRTRSNHLNNKYHGLVETWHESGNPAFRCHYLNGKQNGLCEGYYGDGKLEYSHNYSDDKKHGLQQSYNRDGQVTIQSYYLNGNEVTDAKFKQYLKQLGEQLSLQLNLNEKSLGKIIAEYSS